MRAAPGIQSDPHLFRQVRQIGQGRKDGPIQAIRQVAMPPIRVDQDIAMAFDARIGIDQPQRVQFGQQRGMIFPCDAPDLQIGPGGQIQRAIAEPLRQSAQAKRLVTVKLGPEGSHPHHQPVARHHRAMRAGAPALDLRFGGRDTHSSASSEARTELRRVSQRPASSSALKRSRIAWNACGLACCRKSAVSGSPSVASW